MATVSPVMSVMIKAAEKAARTLIRDFGEVENLQVSSKGPGDFVSAADRRAEENIYYELKNARPDFSFLMEEGGGIEGKDPTTRWIVDPLDGTTNFLHGIPHWAISIAVKDEMFHAEKGMGAWSRRGRLRVSGRSDLAFSTVATGAPRRAQAQKDLFLKEYTAVLDIVPGMRRFGAAALDLCYVAAGRYDGYWERDLKSWDVAAGWLIVKEAGGFVSDIDDDRKNPVETGNIVAANDKLFTDLKKVLRAV
jgi:myo-inositol-1(or 4)-monophosphatase